MPWYRSTIVLNASTSPATARARSADVGSGSVAHLWLDVVMRQGVTAGRGADSKSNQVYTPETAGRRWARRRGRAGRRGPGEPRRRVRRRGGAWRRRRSCSSRAAASAVWPCGSRPGANSQTSTPASSQRPATPRTSRASCQNQRPPGAGHRVPGRAARVEPVDVDGDVDAVRRVEARGELVEQRRAALVHLLGADQDVAGGARGDDFLLARAPHVPQPHLHDGAHTSGSSRSRRIGLE